MGDLEKLLGTLGVAGAGIGIGVGTDMISAQEITQFLTTLDDSFRELVHMIHPYINELMELVKSIKNDLPK